MKRVRLEMDILVQKCPGTIGLTKRLWWELRSEVGAALTAQHGQWVLLSSEAAGKEAS